MTGCPSQPATTAAPDISCTKGSSTVHPVDSKRQLCHGPELADWHSGCGSLYSAPRRLLQDGLATVAVDLRVGKPPKKVYSITEADRRALQDWIDLPASPGSLRDFVTRLILENNLSRSVLIAHHGQRRSEVADHRIDLEGVVANPRRNGSLGAALGT